MSYVRFLVDYITLFSNSVSSIRYSPQTWVTSPKWPDTGVCGTKKKKKRKRKKKKGEKKEEERDTFLVPQRADMPSFNYTRCVTAER
jgi:hypothetical protein